MIRRSGLPALESDLLFERKLRVVGEPRNPYRYLLDDPVRLEASEHTAECRKGTGLPWGSEPPAGERVVCVEGPTLRDLCDALLARLRGEAS